MYHSKVIIACPIHESKDEHIRPWLKYICSQLTYPKYAYEVYLVDNSPNKQWHKKLLREVGHLYPNLTIVHYQPAKKYSYTAPELIAICQNKILEYCKKKKAKSWMHIECDNFSEQDVIERLQAHNKLVVGSYYHTYVGYDRTPLLQTLPNKDMAAHINLRPRLLTYKESINMIKPGLQPIHGMGLGTTLIDMEVFNIKDRFGNTLYFHSDESRKGFSDSHFYADLENLEIEAFVDMLLRNEHRNQSWMAINTAEKLAEII